jgi:hypothetical protein
MSAKSPSAERVKAQIRLLQNPYASLSMREDEEQDTPPKATLEQKQAYFRKLQNPYAYYAIFGDPEDEQVFGSAKIPKQAVLPLGEASDHSYVQQQDSSISKEELEKLVDEVFRLYKPYVARSEWSQVEAYRSSFLKEASSTPAARSRVAARLRMLKFSLMPGEKVEQNRAPAQRLLGELKRLLA